MIAAMGFSTAVERDVRAYFGDRVYESVIPRNVRVSEAPSHGKPVLLYDMKCLGSRAYMNLASEMLRREHMDTPEQTVEQKKAVGE